MNNDIISPARLRAQKHYQNKLGMVLVIFTVMALVGIYLQFN